jgi:hypothetical protein
VQTLHDDTLKPGAAAVRVELSYETTIARIANSLAGVL